MATILNSLTRIYPMKVIQIRSKAEPVNGACNVLFDVGSRIGDDTTTKYVKAAFWSNY